MSEMSYLERVARGLAKVSHVPAQVLPATMAVMYVLLIDRSGSMGTPCGRTNRLVAAQNATIAMLDARQERGVEDQVAVIAFDDDAELVLPFTPCKENRGLIDESIRAIGVAGGTDLNAAFATAMRILPPNERVHMIMLTDGHGGDPTKVAAALKGRGVVIETIGVGESHDEVNETILKRTASVLDRKVLYRFLTDADEMVTYFRTEVANRLVKVADR
jgi:Mg-chelatase subunit ChlD